MKDPVQIQRNDRGFEEIFCKELEEKYSLLEKERECPLQEVEELQVSLSC